MSECVVAFLEECEAMAGLDLAGHEGVDLDLRPVDIYPEGGVIFPVENDRRAA